MSSCDVIEGNLALYERQVSEEQWKSDHEATEQCRALEAVLAHGLMIHEQLQRNDQRASDQGDVSRDALTAHCHAWRWWLEPCVKLLQEVRRFEQLGHAIENAEPFRQRVVAVRSMPLDADEILRLRERFTTVDKTISMKAAFDELLSRAQARGRG